MTSVVDKLLGRLGYHRKENGRRGGIKYEDYCINALWNTEDERRIENLFYLIQAGRLEPDEFERRLERAYNDQTVRFEDGRLFDPVIVTPRKYDMITFTGMIRIAQLVTGRSSQYFTFFASGTGVSEEKLSDSRLQA